MSVRFNLEQIAEALGTFQRSFSAVNKRLTLQREDLTEPMVEHLIQAYAFLNELLTRDMDVFTPVGLHAMLELNHLVLCGDDPGIRGNYYSHITATRKRFLKRIGPVRAFVMKRRKRDANPFETASGFYSRVLSYPQLFLEGNHRTGNILLNYLLVSADESPYVPSAEDAHLYLNLSGDFKLTERDNTFDTALRMPKYRKQFERFLAEHTSDRFALRA